MCYKNINILVETMSYYTHLQRVEMEQIENKHQTSLGEKVAGVLIVLIITYLFIAG